MSTPVFKTPPSSLRQPSELLRKSSDVSPGDEVYVTGLMGECKCTVGGDYGCLYADDGRSLWFLKYEDYGEHGPAWVCVGGANKRGIASAAQ